MLIAWVFMWRSKHCKVLVQINPISLQYNSNDFDERCFRTIKVSKNEEEEERKKKTVWLTTFFKVFCRRKKFIRIWNMRVCKWWQILLIFFFFQVSYTPLNLQKSHPCIYIQVFNYSSYQSSSYSSSSQADKLVRYLQESRIQINKFLKDL